MKKEAAGALAALVAGAVSGALVLGLAGRMAMAGVALIVGTVTNLSLEGLLEVTAMGALAGSVGGLLLLVLKKRGRVARAARGPIAGATLFVSSLLVSWMTGKIDFGHPGPLLMTLFVAAAFFLLYGISADAILSRLEGAADQGH